MRHEKLRSDQKSFVFCRIGKIPNAAIRSHSKHSSTEAKIAWLCMEWLGNEEALVTETFVPHRLVHDRNEGMLSFHSGDP